MIAAEVLSRVTVRQLEFFVMVAETRNFSRAARRLFISQPPLSQQIQRLERTLGFELFVRDKHSVALSVRGDQLLPVAQRVVNEFRNFEDAAHGLQSGHMGRLRIGFAFTALNWGLTEALRQFQFAHPLADLHVSQMQVEHQVAMLLQGGIDVGFAVGHVNMDGVHTTVLGHEEAVVVFPAERPSASVPHVSLLDLRDEVFVGYQAPAAFDYIAQVCNEAGFAPRINIQGAQVHTMIHLVAAGFGITVVPKCDSLLTVPNVAYVPVSSGARIPISAIRAESVEDTSFMKEFVDALCR